MKIYLVGGAVRDQLLGLPVKEKDWVVVGATVDEMLKKGYRQVGKDFPVFLHPKTNEEYALARVERKVGRGYTGFQFDTAATVTLEEDLLRRDLTINAIAQDADGSFVDPYHGQKDLNQKILRHVSPAFAEDPVRILRVARFAARFRELGFTVAPDTIQLMKNMVNAGEVDALVAERVWKELERGLQEKNPQAFFSVLAACTALPVLFPDIKAKNISALENIAALTSDGEIRFAALCYDLSSAQINDLAERYRIPTSYRQLALLVATHYPDYSRINELPAELLLDLLLALDAFRRPERFNKFLQVCAGLISSPQASLWLKEAYSAANAIDAEAIAASATSGPEIAAKIKAQRLDCIKKFLASNP